MHAARTHLQLLAVVGLVACVCVACGGGGNQSRTGTTTGTDGGGLNNVPVFGAMHAVGPEQHTGGVTSRSYAFVGESPRAAIQAYANVMRSTTWKLSGSPQEIGATSWQAAWQRAGNTLVVSTDVAPTLQQGTQTSSQLTLLLYPAGTTPSTAA